MRYQVLRIEEELDFGCEERSSDTPVMAVVTLRDENSCEVQKKLPDQLLYDREIREGDWVELEEELSEIQRAIAELEQAKTAK